jgi:recombination protein RecA
MAKVMPAAALLRARLEAALAHRIPAALSPTPRIIREFSPTGIDSVDELLQGGFPAAAITELVGAECSGRTSLALSFLAGLTHAGKVCAWVDVSDALHPESAAAAGIDLQRLLWVRCGASGNSFPVSKATALPEAHSVGAFTVPEKYFVPRPVKQGLHGGGFGPHPRGEVKGLSSAIAGLLKKEERRVQPGNLPQKTKLKTKKSEYSEAEKVLPNKGPCAPQKPWSRLDQALRTTDLLLQNGGFAAIVLDMGGIAPEHALHVPLATWFRYRAVAGQKQTSIVLLLQHSCAKSSAALTLRLRAISSRSESTVFEGSQFCVEVERQRFLESSENISTLRKPPQAQKWTHWQGRTAWAKR